MSRRLLSRLSIVATPRNVSVFAAVIFSVATSTAFLTLGPPGAGASHEGGMDAMSLDFDTVGNAATTLGSVEPCAVIANNGIVDADEDSVDSVDVDITANNIPTTHRMIAFGGTVGYSEANLTIEDANIAFLLAANSGSSTFNAGEPVPDTNDDDFWISSAADSGGGLAEAGSGVLARITIKADPGAAAGAHPVTLTDGAHIAADGSGYPADQTAGGFIAVDAACPGIAQDADVSVASAALSGPASVAPGEPFTLTGSVTLHNGGPFGPVNTDLTATLSAPAGCTISGSAVVAVPDLTLPLSTDVAVNGSPLTWSVSCSQPGTPLFSMSASAAVDAPDVVDPTPSNNTADALASVPVLAEADIKIASVGVSAPAQKTAGTAFRVDPSAILHNNGPFGPVNVDGNFTLSVTAPCFVLPPTGNKPITQLPLPASVATSTAPLEGWYVSCNTPGTYTATVNANFVLNQDSVSDPNPGNSAGSAQASTVIKVGACGPDPDPDGAALQNPSPLLVSLILALTSTGTSVPAANQTPIDCSFDSNIHDPVGAQIDDCKVATPPAEEPCTVSMNVALGDPAGHPPFQPTVRLLPNSVFFLDPAFDIAGDLEVPNGSLAGSASFGIRTDGGLTPFGTPCIIDARFQQSPAYEGAIAANAPHSTLPSDLLNPNVWPSDLNGERAAVEDALTQLPYPTFNSLNLRSRLAVDLFAPSVPAHLAYNILIWNITDPTIATAFGGEWVVVGFPGDPVDDTVASDPNAPAPGGAYPEPSDPDADDAPSFPIVTCAPHNVNITLNGSAGGAVYVACTEPGDQVIWDLLDPDAVNFTGDQGPRSDSSTCSLDVDNDGLTSEEETYFGTDPLNPDTDGDGFMDGPDNCPATANPGQTDYDGDNVGDICDPDVDGDGAANAGDLCPSTAVGAPADAAGCSQAQVDADLDGACNPGAPSVGPAPGCSGTDLCPGTATGASTDAVGCSQAQVDGDADGACNPGAPSGGPQPCAGTDNCPQASNPLQEDTDNDLQGDVCDSDDDNDGVSDSSEAGCGSDPLAAGARPERTDGAFAGVDDDGDTMIDEVLPPASSTFDCDGDGYTGAAELSIFETERNQDPCGSDSWPSDFVSGQIPESTNRITISDLTSFIAPVRRLDTSPGDGGFSMRWDLNPGPGIFTEHIAINDLTALLAGPSGYPSMFGGARAFSGPACVP